MFKRHVYTCPDVIHMRNRNRKLVLIQLAGLAVLGAIGTVASVRAERELEKNDPEEKF